MLFEGRAGRLCGSPKRKRCEFWKSQSADRGRSTIWWGETWGALQSAALRRAEHVRAQQQHLIRDRVLPHFISPSAFFLVLPPTRVRADVNRTIWLIHSTEDGFRSCSVLAPLLNPSLVAPQPCTRARDAFLGLVLSGAGGKQSSPQAADFGQHAAPVRQPQAGGLLGRRDAERRARGWGRGRRER